MICKYAWKNDKQCNNPPISKKNFCKTHMYYEGKVNPDSLAWCDIHKVDLMILDENKNYYCRYCKKIDVEKKNKVLCKGMNNNGTVCKYKPLVGDEYCKLHQSYKKWKQLSDSGKKMCNNWIRGCWEEIYDEFSRCLKCRKYERIKDKELRTNKEILVKDFNSNNDIVKMCKYCCKEESKLVIDICSECYKKKSAPKKKRIRNQFLNRLYEYRKGAKKRNLVWQLTNERATEMFKTPCFYCNIFNQINGIDRKDNLLGYFEENCVPCCRQCNFMKNNKTIDYFYKICEHISTYNKLYNGNLYPEIFVNSNHCSYNLYILNAKKREIDFKLDEELFSQLTESNCIYCGCFIDGCKGIDRVDSNKPYVKENCVSCCYTCNVHKFTFSQNSFFEKCLAITCKKNNIYYQPEIIENYEQKLIKLFKSIKFVKITDNTIFNYNHKPEYYNSLVWNGNLTDLKNIQIELIFVNNEEFKDIWNYYRNNVSSLPKQKNSKLVGRQIYILVKDKMSSKYLGIMSLNSDIMHFSDRDKYIGWTNDQKVGNKKLNYIMNLSTCVPLQPFGFNFNGGKLLTKLAFSNEVISHFESKYNNQLLGITTTSLYGKSIQYDRLKELQFVGFTKGNSTYKIPENIVNECKKYLLSKGINYSRKFFIIGKTLYDLGLGRDDYMSDTPKGIYFGYCHHQAKDFLCGKINDLNTSDHKNCNDIFEEWFNRWAINRFTHLTNTNRINGQSVKRIETEIISDKDDIIDETIISDIKIKKKKVYNTKPTIISNIPIDKLILPRNFSIYIEKNTQYIQFQRCSKEHGKYSSKIKINSGDIQAELNKLIEKINNDVIIDDNIIINPHLFVFLNKSSNSLDIQNVLNIEKPKLPKYFSICRINNVDNLQFLKINDGKKYQLQRKIKSYDIQTFFDTFINEVNNKFGLSIESTKIDNENNWKTTNNLI